MTYVGCICKCLSNHIARTIAIIRILKPGALAVQLNIVFTRVELKAILVVSPEQIVCDCGVAVATGVGLTMISSGGDSAPAPQFAFSPRTFNMPPEADVGKLSEMELVAVVTVVPSGKVHT